MGSGKFNAGSNPSMDFMCSIPPRGIGESRDTPAMYSLHAMEIKEGCGPDGLKCPLCHLNTVYMYMWMKM